MSVSDRPKIVGNCIGCGHDLRTGPCGGCGAVAPDGPYTPPFGESATSSEGGINA